ncbi:hypothetical protein IB75_11160 [Nitrosococcus oceani C-27]|uniref:Uncharacterized protein n=1 Tax=Nitrosococcus oceani C-27 TaxID=314279 RepID=A0A0E2ZL09_9GAMM|nr:hypothetical protein IB75_11160 [Nitrosococcus oceani C-27]
MFTASSGSGTAVGWQRPQLLMVTQEAGRRTYHGMRQIFAKQSTSWIKNLLPKAPVRLGE